MKPVITFSGQALIHIPQSLLPYEVADALHFHRAVVLNRDDHTSRLGLWDTVLNQELIVIMNTVDRTVLNVHVDDGLHPKGDGVKKEMISLVKEPRGLGDFSKKVSRPDCGRLEISVLGQKKWSKPDQNPEAITVSRFVKINFNHARLGQMVKSYSTRQVIEDMFRRELRGFIPIACSVDGSRVPISSITQRLDSHGKPIIPWLYEG